MGSSVVLEHAARRTVILSGTVAQFNAAFNVQLQQLQHDSCSYRGRTGSIELPSSLDGIVEAVWVSTTGRRRRRTSGFDRRRAPRPLSRRRRSRRCTAFPPAPVSASAWPLIELGGGYRPADLKHLFSRASA